MVDTPAHLRVFISSPGDVADERRIAREVIDQLPHEPLLEGKVTIEAVAWDAPEAPAPLAASETPQESVNRYKGLAADADLTIVILWRRMGTPFIGPQRKPDGTPYRSGTEFEYENAREAGREVWIYHRTEPFDPPDDDARQQRAAVGEFLERVRGPKGTPARGGVNDYASAATFGPLFSKHLQAFVRRRLDGGDSRARSGTLRAPYWLWDDVVTGAGGEGAATLEVAGPGGSVVVPRDIWPEFSDVEQSNRWFAGRTELFDALHAFIDRYPRGYFRIVGDAGLGKTALAVEIARRYRGPAYFVSATAGRTVPEQVLATLCAQAIVRYRLARVPLAADAGRSSDVLLSLLNQAAASADSRPLVVTLDGLDEADATPGGHNWLHLPKTLPDGVYFVLLHRPVDLPVVVEAGVPFESTQISADWTAQLRDVEEYVTHEVARPEIAAWLGRSAPPVSEQELIARLVAASNGNFMYLSYLLADLADPASPVTIDELPRGLEAYYGNAWRQMSEGKTADRKTWKSVQRPVLALLAAAREPVSLDWLASHSGADRDDILDLALAPWGRFLRRWSAPEAWGVVHKSFSDFLAARREIDLPATHRAIADYYLADLHRAEEHDGYAYRHLSAHLADAKSVDGLGTLIENPEWYRAQRQRDSSGRAYSLDVERAIGAARAQGASGLASIVGWSVLFGSVASIASEVPVEALVTLAILGQGASAMAYAELIPDAEQRIDAYVRLAAEFIDTGRQTMARDACRRAYALLPEIWPGNRSTWLPQLASLNARLGVEVPVEAPTSELPGEAADPADLTGGGDDAVDTDEADADETDRTPELANRINPLIARVREGGELQPAIEAAFAGADPLSDDLFRTGLQATATLADLLLSTRNVDGIEALARRVAATPPGLSSAGILSLLSTYIDQVDHVRALELLADADRHMSAAARSDWAAGLVRGELAVRRVEVEGAAAVDAALDTAEALGGYQQAATLTMLARVLSARNDRDALTRLVSRADRVDEEHQAELLGALAAALLANDLGQDADRVVQRARAIEARAAKASAMSAVALEFARTGRRETAGQLVTSVIAESERTAIGAIDVSMWCALASALAASGLQKEAAAALALAETHVDPGWHRARLTMASAVGRVRGAEEARAMLDALAEVVTEDTTLTALADAMAAVESRDGLARLSVLAESVADRNKRMDVLADVGDAFARLRLVDEAERAFAAALRDTDQREHGEVADSYRGSALSHWLDRLAASHAVVPELIDRLRRGGAVSRALDAAAHVQDADWRATAIANAVRVLVHTDERDAALRRMADAAVGDDLQAEVFAEVGRAAAAAGDRAAASAALRDARAAAERAMAERADLERPLVPICDACASIGDAGALAAAAQLAGRLHPEARALVLFAVAAAWLRLNQPEAARTAMDAAIGLALTLEAAITLDSPEYIAWRVRDTMTALAAPSDPATTRWIDEIVAVSRQRGRERVLATIEACAPVFARLGIIGEVWDRLQRVEAVVSPKPV